ncbi:MAG: hypothetical protein E7369_03655 [Clostridiales bacterium]|nr:hypothetical protein [Clostridiales bacterium]
MFGYIKTDYSNLIIKDTVLYKAMYCGLCKSIGGCTNQRARLTLSYDLAFLSVLAHNLLDVDVTIEKQHCVIHPFRKQPMAKSDPLTERIARLNVILAYHKCNDDVTDSNKGRIKRSFIKSAYKKAKKSEPILDDIVNRMYKSLLKYESENSDSIDMVADPFGLMMQEVFEEIFKEKATEPLLSLAYSMGKWIYLIDALDDFDKDKKKKNFNVFINLYKDVNTKQELTTKYRNDLERLFGVVLSNIVQNAKSLEYKFNHDLIDNVLYKGLIAQTKMIMENVKCKNTTKF